MSKRTALGFRSTRVQGKEFTKLRPNLEYLDFDISDNNNVRVFLRDKFTGKRYHKWLNQEEQERFRNSEQYKRK